MIKKKIVIVWTLGEIKWNPFAIYILRIKQCVVLLIVQMRAFLWVAESRGKHKVRAAALARGPGPKRGQSLYWAPTADSWSRRRPFIAYPGFQEVSVRHCTSFSVLLFQPEMGVLRWRDRINVDSSAKLQLQVSYRTTHCFKHLSCEYGCLETWTTAQYNVFKNIEQFLIIFL